MVVVGGFTCGLFGVCRWRFDDLVVGDWVVGGLPNWEKMVTMGGAI